MIHDVGTVTELYEYLTMTWRFFWMLEMMGRWITDMIGMTGNVRDFLSLIFTFLKINIYQAPDVFFS